MEWRADAGQACTSRQADGVALPLIATAPAGHPAIVLDVLFENPLDDLMRDEVDIAIRVLPEPSQALVARELGPVRYLACASRTFIDFIQDKAGAARAQDAPA